MSGLEARVERLEKRMDQLIDVAPENKETFLADVAKGWRVCIYEPVRESLGLKIGDRLRVTVWKDTVRTPVEHEPEREQEPAEPDVEEEPIEEVMEPPSIEEVTTVTGADEEIVVFDEEPEEVVEYVVNEPIVPDYTEELEEEKESEQEYVEPCPSGLDFPLQDLEICRVWKCEHYKRKYGDKSEACNWPDWKKVGWEDELEEEPEEDLVEESETEEPAIEPEEAPEDAEEIVETEVVMLLCESGAHIAELTPHRKTDLGHGWAKYICMVCKKETTTVISRIEG